MELPIYVVDAFASGPFRGNPAAVCPVPDGASVPDSLMANIAAEMNLAETAFLRRRGEANHFDLRWFTPVAEVDLCGHATLASAHALWETGEIAKDDAITFHTRSGELSARLAGEEIQLDFPAVRLKETSLPIKLQGLGTPLYVGNSMDWLVEVASEREVRAYEPDLPAISSLGSRGLILTARGDSGYDFVSRFFAPQYGIPEDPVTGSAHCALAPHWAPKLGKSRMTGYQASKRGGEVGVELLGDRVGLFGKAVTTLSGTLRV